MINRPKNTDSEQDLLKMQLEFLKEKEKNSNFQPAASVVKVNKPVKKQSEFSKRRKLASAKPDEKPRTSNFIIGDIVERSPTTTAESPPSQVLVEPFPKVERINPLSVPTKGVSLFAQMRNCQETPMEMEDIRTDFGSRSFVLQGEEADKIHQQNLAVLSGMSKTDLEKEREQILQTIDPSVLDFIKKIRQNKPKPTTEVHFEPSVPAPTPPVPVPELAKVAQAENWLNFDQIEDDKMQWMQDVTVEVPVPKDGEAYEARFDWKGTLLPFSDADQQVDNRELYLHGDEPHRPGYTLQELFRLARSDVLQQRVSALTSIQGIISIYNQGFYDNVLDLPISKLFFLLRFSLDDKAPGVIEQALLGLANLFYNSSDEFLLDCLFDTQLGRGQPVFQDAKKQMELVNSFKKLTVTNVYQTTVDETDNEADMNDFALAETDLIKCLLRTNIIERIQYLINVLKPEKGSRIKEACVKILIRIARYGPEGIEKITENVPLIDGLIDSVLDEELPSTTALVIKLLRLIIGYSIVPDLNVPLVIDLAKKIVFNRDNLKGPSIRLQTEAFRLLRITLKDRRYQDLYHEILPAIRYLLDWHFNFLDITDSNAVLHQHASSMIALLCHQLYCYDRNPCTEILVLSARKWVTICGSWIESSDSAKMGFSQNLLLCVVFEFCAENTLLYHAVKPCLSKWIHSKAFTAKMLGPLSSNSSMKKIISDRRDVISQLPNFGSVAFDRQSKVSLVIAQDSTVLIMNAMLRLLTKYDPELLKEMDGNSFREILSQFTTHNVFVGIMKKNWFCRHDLELVFSIIQSGICKDIGLVLKVTGLFVTCVTLRAQIEHLLQDIFFNPEMYKNKLSYSDGEILMWKDVYMQYYVMRQQTLITPEDSMLPVNWPYAILDIFYEQHVESKDNKKISFNIEKETEDRLIRVSMGMTTLLEANGVHLVTPTERLIHLMMAFLSPECRFLEAQVKECLLHRALFLKNDLHGNLSFEFKTDTFDFESFYTVLLNHFQSSGYADKLFGAVIMIPLATKYDVKWRKMIWSEHVAVLRFISCSEDELIFSQMEDFIQLRKSAEDPNYELSLLKSYNLAISMNQLRVDSIPYKIAQFYLANK